MASTATIDADPVDDLYSILAEQQFEFTAAQTLQSDLDFAFRLQLEEAIAASLVKRPSTSTSSSSAASSSRPLLLQQAPQSETVVSLRSVISKEELKKTDTGKGEEKNEMSDEFEIKKPYGEGSSKAVVDGGDDDNEFSLYCKGMVSEERVRGQRMSFTGIGVAICDPKGSLVLELKKALIDDGKSKNGVELRAVIEGLSAALTLKIKRIRFFTDYHPVFQFVTGKWPPKQRKIAVLVSQVYLLRREFQSSYPVLVSRNDLKYGLQLARDAIVCQATKAKESSGKPVMESCVICLEDVDVDNMFEVDNCLHRYCFSCMRMHVDNKLLHATVPKCPHEDCKSELKVDSCKIFLTPKLLEKFEERKREASIPVTEKVYCPYPNCSALMTQNEVLKYSVRKGFFDGKLGARTCLKCQRIFCINCKVPWHESMSCSEYKKLNPNPPMEDVKLKSLATVNLWRQCVKCNHMIELSEGCYHMTCRCGYEFCYHCGAEWKNKKPTCSCPLWHEGNIIHSDEDISDDDMGFPLGESDEEESDYELDWHPVEEQVHGRHVHWGPDHDISSSEEGDQGMDRRGDNELAQDVDLSEEDNYLGTDSDVDAYVSEEEGVNEDPEEGDEDVVFEKEDEHGDVVFSGEDDYYDDELEGGDYSEEDCYDDCDVGDYDDDDGDDDFW